MTLNRDPKRGFEAYSDAALADHPDGKSTQGWVIFFAGCPITWASSKQSIVAPSSTAAEYICLSELAKVVLYARRLLSAFRLVKEDEAITVYTDSDNGVKATTKKGLVNATRWLATRYHFVTDQVNQGNIVLQRVETKKNPADGFTKALDSEKFATFKELLFMEIVQIPTEEEM